MRRLPSDHPAHDIPLHWLSRDRSFFRRRQVIFAAATATGLGLFIGGMTLHRNNDYCSESDRASGVDCAQVNRRDAFGYTLIGIGGASFLGFIAPTILNGRRFRTHRRFAASDGVHAAAAPLLIRGGGGASLHMTW